MLLETGATTHVSDRDGSTAWKGSALDGKLQEVFLKVFLGPDQKVCRALVE